MPTKSTKAETKPEAKPEGDCDCKVLNSELERYTQLLSELDQKLQAKDTRIEELEEALAKCGDSVKVQRERDHALNRVQQLETINADLDGKVKVLAEENAQLNGCVKAFKAAFEQVNKLTPMRSSSAPASAGRTSLSHQKKIPKFTNDGINPDHPAHPAHPGHETYKASLKAKAEAK